MGNTGPQDVSSKLEYIHVMAGLSNFDPETGIPSQANFMSVYKYIESQILGLSEAFELSHTPFEGVDQYVLPDFLASTPWFTQHDNLPDPFSNQVNETWKPFSLDVGIYKFEVSFVGYFVDLSISSIRLETKSHSFTDISININSAPFVLQQSFVYYLNVYNLDFDTSRSMFSLAAQSSDIFDIGLSCFGPIPQNTNFYMSAVITKVSNTPTPLLFLTVPEGGVG